MPFARRLAATCPARCAVALGLALAGCAPLPDLASQTQSQIASQTQSLAAPPPVLVPLGGILAQADAVGSAQAAIAPVNARAERLRSRTRRLPQTGQTDLLLRSAELRTRAAQLRRR